MKKSFICFCLLFSVISLTPPHTYAAEETLVPITTHYYQIEEPFTINFRKQSQQKVQYLQIKVALMSEDAEVIKNTELNLPLIQDALRILFTKQSYDTVSTVVGREKLQGEALTLVNSLLQEETGNGALNQVYFTSFILQ